MDPPFDKSKSETAAWLACGKDCSSECVGGRCKYEQSYAEGSSIKGFWFQDKMMLGDAAESNPAVVAQLGCHSSENELFYIQRANGILGLAPYQGGRPTILNELFADASHVDNNIFSICLAAWGGALNVGGYNRSYWTGKPQWIPLQLQRYYTVALQSMQVDGQVVAEGEAHFGTAILDSGTTYTYFPADVYHGMDNAITKYCAAHGGCAAQPIGNCWKITGPAGPTQFPVVAMRFNGALVYWPASSYLFQRGDTQVWCRAYGESGFARSTLLGSTWMIGKEIIFDIQTRVLGLSRPIAQLIAARLPNLSASTVLARQASTPRRPPTALSRYALCSAS